MAMSREKFCKVCQLPNNSILIQTSMLPGGGGDVLGVSRGGGLAAGVPGGGEGVFGVTGGGDGLQRLRTSK